jgi:hypothetical protein
MRSCFAVLMPACLLIVCLGAKSPDRVSDDPTDGRSLQSLRTGLEANRSSCNRIARALQVVALDEQRKVTDRRAALRTLRLIGSDDVFKFFWKNRGMFIDDPSSKDPLRGAHPLRTHLCLCYLSFDISDKKVPDWRVGSFFFDIYGELRSQLDIDSSSIALSMLFEGVDYGGPARALALIDYQMTHETDADRLTRLRGLAEQLQQMAR